MAQQDILFPEGINTAWPKVQANFDEVYPAVALNTAKTGITAQQASDITTNNAKTISDVAYGPTWDGNTDAASKNTIYDKLEADAVNEAFRQVTYAASVTDTYNLNQPNFYINLTGDITLAIGSITSGGGIVNIVRDNFTRAITLTGTLGNEHRYSGTDLTVRLTYYYENGSVIWYCNNQDFVTIPQNSKSAAYTLVLADAGKHLLHPSADTTARTWTIPANSSVAFPIGTAVTFVNQNAGGSITIAITTDTMRLAGAGTTGSRTLAANGIATAMKITSTEWIISGTNLT